MHINCSGFSSTDFAIILNTQVDDASPSVAFPEVVSDAGLLIIAGSDTTATVIANVFYYLVRNRDKYQTLKNEVDKEFPAGGGDATDSLKLAKMPYLNAVMWVYLCFDRDSLV